MKTSLFIPISITLGVCMTTFSASAQGLDRTKRPAPQKPPTITLPAIKKSTLKNGLAVWLVEYHKLPIVALNMVFQSGADCDPADRSGTATLTADMLDAGTKTLDALQIADRLDFIGATLRVNAGFDATSATLSTLSKHLDDALAVYTDVLTNASFPPAEFDRIRKQRLTALIQQKDRPATIASLAFNHILYGASHPYGNDPSGSDSSISSITRESIVKFYDTYYRPNNATLIVVGDVTMAELLPKLEKGFGEWHQGTIPELAIPPTPALSKRVVYLIDKPGAPQSEIRIGYPALARSTPDFFAVQVMNRLLGGQFSSRINMNLREKHGYTYGARSVFTFTKLPGPFVASGGFVSTKTDSSINELLFEIDRTQKEGVSAEELEFSKKGMVGSFAQTFETPLQIAMALQNIAVYKLPEDYFNHYLQNITSVTLKDVTRVSGQYLDSSQMAIVVVGDIKQIRQGVEALNLGELRVCDLGGNPIQK
jgi:zinc protease